LAVIAASSTTRPVDREVGSDAQPPTTVRLTALAMANAIKRVRLILVLLLKGFPQAATGYEDGTK
jgi:hypothetical protein